MKNFLKFSILLVLILFAQTTHAILGGRMLRERDPTGPSRGVVFLEIKRGDVPLANCSGTLIAKNVVLTAAHCFDNTLIPGLDSFDILIDSFQTGSAVRIRLPGTYSKKHPRYKNLHPRASILNTDIALAFFEGEIPDDVSPVPFDTNTKSTYSGRAVHIFGYGRSVDYSGKKDENLAFSVGILRHATVQISELDYRQVADRYYVQPFVRTPAYLCQGDSGGPHFLVNKKEFKLIGVTSGGGVPRSNGTVATCVGPGISTKVALVARWIQEQIRNYK